MKKFFALLLALTMVFAMSTTAFAAETTATGSITVNNTVSGQTYTIYRIFDLESYNTTSGAYSYTVNESWKTFVEQESISGDEGYVTVDDQGYVTWKDSADVAKFAAAAIAYAQENTIANSGTATATSTTVKFDNLSLGYYMVDSGLGSLCALTTTNPNSEVIEKNAKPSVNKEVKEGDSYGDKNDANIGDTVYFQTTIAVQGLAKDYVLHDTMSEGLTFDANSVSVTLNSSAVNASSYTVKTESLTDGCTFEVDFTDDFEATLKSGDVIVVSYAATVNSYAVVDGDGNSNKTKLEYKDNAGEKHETTEDETKTYTWELNIYKYTNTTENEAEVETPLAGAEFILYKNVGTEAESSYKYATVKDGEISGWVDSAEYATKLTSDANGMIQIDGLDSGTYYLKETKAPEGYNKLASDVEITITTTKDETTGVVTGSVTGAANVTVNDVAVSSVKVENNAGSKLPETGGIGTTIFYVVGGLMMLGAAVLLITKKKMSIAE